MCESTAKDYRRHQRRWLAWCRRNGVNPIGAPVAAVEAFVSRSRVIHRDGSVHAPSATTHNARRQALVMMYDRMAAASLAPSNPARLVPRRPVDQTRSAGRRLSPGQIAALLAAAKEAGPAYYAATRALCDLGVRGVEVQRSRLCDWQPRADGGPVLRTIGRGELTSFRSVPAVTVEAVEDALAWRRLVCPRRTDTHTGGALFVLPRGRLEWHQAPEPVTADSLDYMLRVLGARAGIGRVSAHDFRRCWVRHALQAGCSLEEIRDEIGHRDTKTTMRYAAGARLPISRHACRIQAAASSVAEAVVLLRAMEGGEVAPVAEAIRAMRAEQETAHPVLSMLRELEEGRARLDREWAQIAELRARLGVA